MDFTIYSIGETAFLYEIIMGLRRMFDYGFSSLHILIGSVAGISLLTLIVKSWINPNSNPVLSWFIGMIMFMILCGPGSKVDVSIESIRTGQVYYVSDAPGIVAIAALMTSGMYGLFDKGYRSKSASVSTSLGLMLLIISTVLESCIRIRYGSSDSYIPRRSFKCY